MNKTFLITDCTRAISRNPNCLLNVAREYFSLDLYEVTWPKNKRYINEVYGYGLPHLMHPYDISNDIISERCTGLFDNAKSGDIYWVHTQPRTHTLDEYSDSYPNTRIKLIKMNMDIKDIRDKLIYEAIQEIRNWFLKCSRYDMRYKKARAYRDLGIKRIIE